MHCVINKNKHDDTSANKCTRHSLHDFFMLHAEFSILHSGSDVVQKTNKNKCQINVKKVAKSWSRSFSRCVLQKKPVEILSCLSTWGVNDTMWTVEFAFYVFKRITLGLHNDIWNGPRSLGYEISADKTPIHPCTSIKIDRDPIIMQLESVFTVYLIKVRCTLAFPDAQI